MNMVSINILLVLFSIIGFLLSYYAYNVEVRIEENVNYVAMCDISEHMSCTKAFKSEFGKGFGLVQKVLGEDSKLNQPNGVYGLIFYTIFGLLSFSKSRFCCQVMIWMSALSNLATIYLAYVLYFVLYDACIVCISMYLVNAALLWLAVRKLDLIANQAIKTKQN